MLSLAAVAAIAAMAFVAASSASAATALCKVNETKCAEANLAKPVHFTDGTTVLKTSILTVLCLSSFYIPRARDTVCSPQPNSKFRS
jgi:hypothetical protein